MSINRVQVDEVREAIVKGLSEDALRIDWYKTSTRLIWYVLRQLVPLLKNAEDNAYKDILAMFDDLDLSFFFRGGMFVTTAELRQLPWTAWKLQPPQ